METQETRVRHGIELVEKRCKWKKCRRVFWATKKSPQKHCSIDCQLDDGVVIQKWVLNRIRGG